MTSCERMIEGRCSIDLFGGTPTPKQCDGCVAYLGPIRGVGDVVALALSRLGADKVASKNCRCGKRRATLNKILPTRNP